jgi:nicotinate phosphoribosyltransferase
MTAYSPSSGLLTDLYELTMAAGYFETGFNARATFELFVRTLPPRRNYLVAAGLDQALDFLAHARFSPEEIAYLRKLPVFGHVGDDFFEYLAEFKFTGDVWAMPEGTIFFPDEPIVRVTAPIIEAQIVETCLLAVINFQTMIASKSARVTEAAGDRSVIEFGTRRAHGIESGVLAARAAVIGGCQGTSNVAAGYRFGIPVYGTQAHSWVMAHDNEEQAFGHFLDIFPGQALLLVDTYDVRAAVEMIIAMGRKPRGIRLDSGNLAADSVWARDRLDRAGWNDAIIFASGDLDEDRIVALLEEGARVDAFGVGTALATSSDAPTLGVIYKLVETEIDGEVRPAAKFSAAKATYPGKKQVFRFSHPDGRYANDIVGLAEEDFPGGELFLEQVMTAGERTGSPADLNAARERFLQQRERMPEGLRRLSGEPAPYPVRHSERLERLLNEVRRRVERAAHI